VVFRARDGGAATVGRVAVTVTAAVSPEHAGNGSLRPIRTTIYLAIGNPGMMQDRWRLLVHRVRRLEKREVRDLRRWFERTNTLIHLSVLVLVPALMAVVTTLSNAVGTLSFLVYPPLASGAYTLFADPGGRYASPLRFVAGLTVGAVCGLAGVEAAALLYTTPPGQVHAAGAALTIFLTGLVTWLLGVEEPSAFAMSLVTLFVQARVDRPGYFVLSAAIGSAIVALAFVGWRHWIYEQRARYLYETTSSDDHVLVPMRGPHAGATAMLAAQLAAAHRAGKVVLLDIVEEEWLARAERSLLEAHGGTDLVRTGPSLEGEPVEDDALDPDSVDAHEAVSEAVYDLEQRAGDIETRVSVPCQVVVATAGAAPAETVLRTARQANCDLVATPYDADGGSVSDFVGRLFQGERDVLVHRSHQRDDRWERILVAVRGESSLAHSMIDFATRLAGDTGEVSVGTCVVTERERRRAEETLADVVEPFGGNIETRVSQSSIEDFLARHGQGYDLVIIGASQDRSVASRFVSPPTFERIDSDEIGTDVAIVDRH
jgi:hypothetical protein